MVKFCSDYNIVLAHSTVYYPKGNGLEESSNKTLVRMIKNILQDNKRAWHTKLKFALWDDRISTERALGTSLFQLVYGLDVVFPTSLGLLVMKYLHEEECEPNAIQRSINQLIYVQQMRESVYDRSQLTQDKMKKHFDRKVKADDFQLGDLVLKWDARFEEKR